ncbi:MAG: hypothetical protein IPP74_03200 [Alphaproteobacteria bacterium]|nr:hypothetical protein [Alphaproteobacteria bacterium]
MKTTSNTHTEFVGTGKGICGASTSVAWSAVFAGAFTAAAVSLTLLFLGSALGLAAVSPWAHVGISATTFTVSTILWLIIMQCISSGLGGYLTGRLRCKVVNLHTDEVYFRDTAHGFLSWSLATVISAGFLGSAISSVIGGGATAVTAISAGTAAGAGYAQTQKSTNGNFNMINESTNYIIDSLFRTDHVNPLDSDSRIEAIRILIVGMKNGTISIEDKDYLTQIVESHTKLNEADASKRVDDVIAQLNSAKLQAKQEADAARKTAMHTALYVFLSTLSAAFIASSAAALGGKHRDQF